ncbi:MAG TPA: carbohydrate ABC transporter permease [Tepidisphaeraceae bacterium]|nr:carbohydrate ABC transporter permease [Tepidisphaeraceae bacterium]
MRRESGTSSLHTYAILVAGSIVMLTPLAWMVLTSLKSFEEVIASPPAWLPEEPKWGNYREALTTFDFSRYLFNSLLVCALTIAGTLVSCTLAAYAFACLRARGRDLIFALLLSTMMLPAQVTIIPLFQLFVAIGWVNTLYPLIVPSWFATNVFAIFLLRQFFIAVPRDYIEAARIDGASELRILWSIFVPLSKPVLLTVTVFSFIASWNDLWGPLIYLHDDSLSTMPLGLLNFIGTAGRAQGSPWHLVMAVSTVMMVPVVVLFFLAQKRFIEGIATSGVKG